MNRGGMGTGQGSWKDMATMTDQPKPPEGLPEGWRKTWACADFLPDPGPGIVRNAIRALAAERKARDAAEARVRELEEAIIKGHPVDCAYVGATQSLQLQRDRDRAQVARLTEERDKARADFQWMVDRAADQRLDGYRELGQRAAAAENARDEARQTAQRRDELLREATKRLAQNNSAWVRQPADCLGYDLETGHPYREELIARNGRTQDRICAELDGSPEPAGLSGAPPVSAMRWVADTVERGDSEVDCSLEEVNAVIRWLRAWAERAEETKDNE